MPRVTAVLVWVLLLGQGALVGPLLGREVAGRVETLSGWSAQAAQSVARRLPAARVRVNRTLPRVTPPNLRVAFGAAPTVEALTHARVFSEPLIPVGAVPSAAQNRTLARALEAFASSASPEDRLKGLQDYLAADLGSPWRAAVAGNLGTLLWNAGYFSRAARFWTDAWELAKDATTPRERAVADTAIGELMTHHLVFGQVPALTARAAELDGRAIGGTAGNKVEAAREGLGVLVNHHETALFSGPAALAALIDAVGAPHPDSRETVMAYKTTHEGMSLTDVQGLATTVGLAARMRHVSTPAELPVPSVVHLKSDHFTTVVERRGDAYVLRDGALGGFVMRAEALQDEMTGYVLVPDAATEVGRAVGAEEAQTVIGHCIPGWPSPNDPRRGPEPCRGGCPAGGGPGGDGGGGGSGPRGPGGMPAAFVHAMSASVLLVDRPLSYAPPKGPAVDWQLSYDQRTQRLPQVPTFGHVGPRWTHDWQSWVTDNVGTSGIPGHWADVVVRGETLERFSTFDGPTNWRSRATLVKVAHDPARYERRLPDGTVEVFTFADSGPSTPYRRIFLTQVIDPQGLALTFTYDAQIRLVAVTDALGQVTTLQYLDGADPLRLTKVTDPFGRFATLTYDAAGRIETLTDTIGLTSRVAYAPDDFVQSLTTPYGTTAFRRMDGNSVRRIDITDPEGGTERVEFHFVGATLGITPSLPPGEVPAGFADMNQGLDHLNSLHWDKKAMAEAPGDLSRATLTHWLMGADMAYMPTDSTQARLVPHSVKPPLETRIWYRYQNQPNHQVVGQGVRPTVAARLLENGTTQTSLATYNALGKITSTTDPLGRQTQYAYAANGIDLLTVRQLNGGTTDLRATYAGYSALHLPATVTDAAGQTTTTSYNAAGQPLTVTNAKNEVTTYTYSPTTGYLQTVAGPVPNSTTTYGYDGYGRLNSVTEPDGYSVTMLYDALNRLTRRTYPDGTFEETTYARLDTAIERDRKGRVTRHFYDGMGRRTSTRDPQGRVVTQVWCSCGALDAIIDANGNKTTWERDWQNRVTREVRADGTTDTLYTYDATGRLKTVTDPKNQVTTYSYATDDRLLTTVYTNATIPTPGVTYTYDPIYPRMTTMVDGIGTTSYAYKAPGVLGAEQVASVDGPLANDTITYTYDQLRRVTVRAINGGANTVTWAFDPLGRVASETNVLGPFTYTYDGATSRLATVTYPNNQTGTFAYFPNNQDRRLQSIHHKYPNGTTLSKFDYSYDAVGNILTWRQQADTTAVNWRYGYDAADQLTSATKESTDPVPVIQKRFAYGYDPAANRLFEQIDDQVMAGSHDNLNRLTQHTPGGPLQFVGTVNEPANVTVAGQPASVDPTNTFRGPATAIAGTTTVSITATDPSGNVASRQYEVDVTGAAKTFVYDANGNMTGDGTRTFEWDARNQLVAVSVGTQRTEFAYDGARSRLRATHRMSGTIVQDVYHLHCDVQICEDRDWTSGVVSRQSVAAGEKRDGVLLFFAVDHLGSVTDVTSSTGTLVERFNFDPWGRRYLSSGVGQTVVGYTGHLTQSSALSVARYRQYDAALGVWLSEDPLLFVGVQQGYANVRNNPVKYEDPLGLFPAIPVITAPFPGYNHCGAGTLGDDLDGVNILDQGCKRHDRCYQNSGEGGLSGVFGNNDETRCAMNECDRALCGEAVRALDEGGLSYYHLTVARSVAALFCFRVRVRPELAYGLLS